MLELNFPPDPASPLKILCLGAHSDDIEIGCGGTILHLLSHYPNLDVVWVVFSSGRERAREARRSSDLFLKKAKQNR
jgi:LmbE family N-acetylglucosaminyl deacetylase